MIAPGVGGEYTSGLFLTEPTSSCTQPTESERDTDTGTTQRIRQFFKIKRPAWGSGLCFAS